jgi:hypothetical protein
LVPAIYCVCCQYVCSLYHPVFGSVMLYWSWEHPVLLFCVVSVLGSAYSWNKNKWLAAGIHCAESLQTSVQCPVSTKDKCGWDTFLSILNLSLWKWLQFLFLSHLEYTRGITEHYTTACGRSPFAALWALWAGCRIFCTAYSPWRVTLKYGLWLCRLYFL